ncbi:RNA-directed DNA polymerase [Maribacter sp. MAR_2009_72]|uniref:RNA-directed DNA polymerase n=1 Tax=Maribacter sp. MAR_2009_72 TaxID=1250050 RepID=UPI00119C11C2|nr:RNA-directed DNA polymerase [Maribacter sp. MAR_2009_72]TVZ13947.1 reverse transcriptase (RNA-dependent DNA polymerase) [Maribacter sp. MAR_2009_72]
MPKYKIRDIEIGYRKLKSYVYYDNFSLLLRQKIAQFETNKDFENKLEKLANFLSNPNGAQEQKYFNNLLSEIKYYTAPKRFAPLREEEQLVISNNFSANQYNLEKVNYFFDGPVELHIITVLWIIHEGYVLHKTYSKDNYAYHLELESGNGEVVDGLRLFKPYFEQYQKWRDNGLDIAKEFLEKDTDVVILTLDIKSYYYNAKIDTKFKENLRKDLFSGLNKRKLPFTDLLFDIIFAYQKICIKKGNNILPIGLLSSGILANYYLKEFDSRIKKELSPAYYGRYVDDIQIILSNTKIGKNKTKGKSSVKDFLDKYLVQRGLFDHKIDNDDVNAYTFKSLPNIQIQQEKILLYAFESKESRAVLDMFRRKIEQNSSAFWFLPSEDEITDDFDSSVYQLSYSDTINKLRSVQGINQSKYGAAVYLAKKIKISLLSDKDDSDLTKEQILTFFKGIVSLEFSASWEKVFTYFVIINDRDSFWNFFREISKNIEKIKPNNESISRDDIKDVKDYLTIYLENCCALATALNPAFVSDHWWAARKESLKSKKLRNAFTYSGEINAIKKAYLKSSMLRNSFIVTPLLNYLNISDNEEINFIHHEGLRIINFKSDELIFNDKKLKYAPRFLYFFEFNLVFLLIELLKYYKENSEENDNQKFFKKLSKEIYEEMFDKFFLTNYSHRLRISNSQIKAYKENLRNYYFKITDGSDQKNIDFNYFEIPQSGKNLQNFKVAVANTTIDKKNISDSIFENPNTGYERRKQFINLINSAEIEKSDALILPEVSVPYSWLPVLADESRRKQRLIVAGLEHLTIGRTCFNLLATCLPLEHNGIKDAVINLRLKHHYSPGEKKIIRQRRRYIPKTDYVLYNLFKWRGVHFANYNCYELADINHRALFKGKVDVLIASEYNQDVNYFSNIAESVSRDIHCYFVQVNTSDYGDSRITLPKKTELKDVMRLKGGENHIVLTCKLNIKELRDFQKLSVPYQDTRKFKNTPPDFNHDEVEKR